MDKICPLCHVRISGWMIASGKTTTIKYDIALQRSEEVVHNSCRQDFKLKTGKEYGRG